MLTSLGFRNLSLSVNDYSTQTSVDSRSGYVQTIGNHPKRDSPRLRLGGDKRLIVASRRALCAVALAVVVPRSFGTDQHVLGSCTPLTTLPPLFYLPSLSWDAFCSVSWILLY